MELTFWQSLIFLGYFLVLLAWDILWIVVPVALLVGGVIFLIRKRLRVVGPKVLSGKSSRLTGGAMILSFISYAGTSLFAVNFVILDGMISPYWGLIDNSLPLDRFHFLINYFRFGSFWIPLFPLFLMITIFLIVKPNGGNSSPTELVPSEPSPSKE